MKSVIIEYAKIAPDVLADKIEFYFDGALCYYHDLDENYYDFTVIGVTDLADLEDLLAEYM